MLSPEECWQPFVQAPRLGECLVSILHQSGNTEPPATNSILVHHHPDTLAIMEDDVSDPLMHPFSRLTLPSLQSLVHGGHSMKVEALCASFIRSSSPLTHLHLIGWRPSDRELIQLLYASPSLTTFETYDVDVGEAFFNSMVNTTFTSCDNDGPLFLPCLEKLCIHSRPSCSSRCVPMIFGVGPSAPNLRRRPLKTLKITIPRLRDGWIDQESLLQMLKIIEGGVALTIVDEDSGSCLIAAAQKCYAERGGGSDEVGITTTINLVT